VGYELVAAHSLFSDHLMIIEQKYQALAKISNCDLIGRFVPALLKGYLCLVSGNWVHAGQMVSSCVSGQFLDRKKLYNETHVHCWEYVYGTSIEWKCSLLIGNGKYQCHRWQFLNWEMCSNSLNQVYCYSFMIQNTCLMNSSEMLFAGGHETMINKK